MPMPQPAIFASEGPHHLFLEFSVPTGGDEARKALAGTLEQAREALGSDGEAESVLGFGASLWRALTPGEPPEGLRPFRTLHGKEGRRVPGTQNDLWLWVSGAGRDRVFGAGKAFHDALGDVATLRLEQSGFKYLDSRDLTGFIDGSANPEGDERLEVALVPAGQAGAGGSHILAQRWVHDLASFHALPEAEQERVIGRSKADSVEMPPETKPPWAHIARTEIERDGEEIAIYRRSVPFGGMARHGLYFLAFAAEAERFDIMLQSMYGLTADGIVDRLTDFSRPESSATYFAPSQEDLEKVLTRLR